MQREGVFREMKRRRVYEKPFEKANREQAEAIRRGRKVARKKAQREGFIAAPRTKKVPLGRSTNVAHSRSRAQFHVSRDEKMHLPRRGQWPAGWCRAVLREKCSDVRYYFLKRPRSILPTRKVAIGRGLSYYLPDASTQPKHNARP
jgi:hypothetical protein